MIRGLFDLPSTTEGLARLRPQIQRPATGESEVIDYSVVSPSNVVDAATHRRTPRVSVVVVLPENHVVSPDGLLHGLRSCGEQDVDVLVACAGQPTNLTALQRCVGDAQFLLAPAGTSPEDLREMAMAQAPGDIVTLLRGALLSDDARREQPLIKTS